MKTLSQLKAYYSNTFRNRTLGDLLSESFVGIFFKFIMMWLGLLGGFFLFIGVLLICAWILVNIVGPIFSFIFT